MKTATRWLLMLLIALAAGFGSFAATRSIQSRPATQPTTDSAADTMLNWLNVPSSQRDELRRHDPSFGADLDRLRSAVISARNNLASALEKPETSDEVIRQRVEDVLAASNALERRITGYLVTVRHHLTADQQKRLLQLCAAGIREGGGRCWRGGNGPGPGAGNGMGPGGRGGGGMGMGRGMGRGPR